MSLLPFFFYNIKKSEIVSVSFYLTSLCAVNKKKVWNNMRVIKLRQCWVNLNKTESIRPISD